MKYFELISVFLTIEKTIKKYDLKPTGSIAMHILMLIRVLALLEAMGANK